MAEFDKKTCLGNIYYLAKQRGIKIGDLEAQSKVSTGYLSRLAKEDNKSVPGIEALEAFANALGVTVDDLLHCKFGDMTPTEKYLLDFIAKLSEETNNGDHFWKRIPAKEFPEVEPFFRSETRYESNISSDYPEAYEVPVYNSLFANEGDSIACSGEVYTLELSSQNYLYIVKVEAEPKSAPFPVDGYELYMMNNGVLNPLCTGVDWDESAFFLKLRSLYTIVADSCNHARITKDVRKVIDAFMSRKDSPVKKQSDSDLELPF